MMIVEISDQPVGKMREIFAIYVRGVDPANRGQWSSWYRSTQRQTLEDARSYVKEEAGRDTSLGGFITPSGPRQFMIRKCVETVVECWDTSAKKIEPTKRRKRA